MVESSKAKTERTLINNNNKVKESWDYNRSTYNYEKESRTLGSKFSWPPRLYTCSFCKREFMSAQALGGHMNVHRRERAMLNQSIPWDINLQHAKFISPIHILHPSSSTTSFTNHHFPPAYPPTYDYNSLPSRTTPPTITACSSSAPPYSTDANIIRPTSFSQFSSSKGQENVEKNTSATLPMMEMLLEVGDQHLMNESYHHRQCFGDNNMKIHGDIVRLDLDIGLCSEDDLDLELRLGFSESHC